MTSPGPLAFQNLPRVKATLQAYFRRLRKAEIRGAMRISGKLIEPISLIMIHRPCIAAQHRE